MSADLVALTQLPARSPDLVGRVAVVTGAARGIGFAIANELAALGARVAVLDREGATGAAARVAEGGAETLGLEADLTQPDDIERAFAAVLERYGRVDILVNNAGLGDRTSLSDLGADHLRRLLTVNLMSAMLCSQAALPAMTAQGGGKIVNISSVSAKVGGVSSRDPITGEGRSGPAYAAAKGGMLAFTRWLAKDAGAQGIHVNAICPGPIATDAITGAEYDLSATPIARLGTTADVVQAVVYLASQMSNYVTGQSLNVDGGLRMD